VRTTLTLDDDVAALLKKEIGDSGLSFKDAVNHYLRLGMVQAKRNPERKPFVVKSRPLGLPAGMSYDSVSQLLEDLEGPMHR
jgi:hypothetical protein